MGVERSAVWFKARTRPEQPTRPPPADTSPGRLAADHSDEHSTFQSRQDARSVMHSPFDIPADLDTPVSAYRKLEAFRPCFLLESAEGGARLARYSFIGLDPAFTASMPANGSTVDIKSSAGFD